MKPPLQFLALIAIATFLVVSLDVRLAASEVITLNDGRVLHGEVRDDGDEYIVKLKAGVIRIKKADVQRISAETVPASPPATRPAAPSPVAKVRPAPPSVELEPLVGNPKKHAANAPDAIRQLVERGRANLARLCQRPILDSLPNGGKVDVGPAINVTALMDATREAMATASEKMKRMLGGAHGNGKWQRLQLETTVEVYGYITSVNTNGSSKLLIEQVDAQKRVIAFQDFITGSDTIAAIIAQKIFANAPQPTLVFAKLRWEIVPDFQPGGGQDVLAVAHHVVLDVQFIDKATGDWSPWYLGESASTVANAKEISPTREIAMDLADYVIRGPFDKKSPSDQWALDTAARILLSFDLPLKRAIQPRIQVLSRQPMDSAARGRSQRLLDAIAEDISGR